MNYILNKMLIISKYFSEIYNGKNTIKKIVWFPISVILLIFFSLFCLIDYTILKIFRQNYLFLLYFGDDF